MRVHYVQEPESVGQNLVQLAEAAIASETQVRAECVMLYEKLSQRASARGARTVYLTLICRHLEGILRHVVCVTGQGAGAALIG
jgi:hypothetical protein